MKAIIIETPGKGKTTLTHRIKENYSNIRVVSVGGLRSPLGIHEPHKGYETEVSPDNMDLFVSVIDNAMSQYNDYIVEGYGLAPEDALFLGKKHHCPVVLLCHKNTSAEEDFGLVRKYDAKDKWTAFRTDEYLKKLYAFYKSVEEKWIKRMPEEMVFATDDNFELALRNAYHYIISNQFRNHKANE